MINFSVTHSFITHGIIERLGLKPTFVGSICNEILDRDNIPCNQMLLGKTVALRGKEMEINLIVFDMSDFDMILGIDFLSLYRAEIDYRKKEVRFHLDNGEKFTFDEGHVLSMMISGIKTKKLLSKGYMDYLAHVVGKDDDLVLSLQSTHFVDEFLYVFPKKLSRLALKRGEV